MAKQKVKMLLNLGWQDAHAYGICEESLEKCKEGAVLDLDEREADILINKIHCATAAPAALQQHSVTAPSEDSPVKDMNAAEAIPHIAAMRSKEKLQAIIDEDPRTTVVDAAKKRLTEV